MILHNILHLVSQQFNKMCSQLFQFRLFNNARTIYHETCFNATGIFKCKKQVQYILYLEEETETDPLIVPHISSLFWIYCLVNTRMSNINTCRNIIHCSLKTLGSSYLLASSQLIPKVFNLHCKMPDCLNFFLHFYFCLVYALSFLDVFLDYKLSLVSYWY